ncbi:hypothetical protein RchiOBHm_Chr5g0018671 [Rosa chinensis]|uniref:Uncharacterized protein n=1 Tax=Rosa chinensis TaxID=74649 RepID=A0A2P6Q6U7_ROSCH|nr:hypothetical protein RchiOBHm_Chr5g0018671 [Rosa chinensis]
MLRIYTSHMGEMGPCLWVYKGLGHSIHCQLVLDVNPRLLYHGIKAGYPCVRA